MNLGELIAQCVESLACRYKRLLEVEGRLANLFNL
jgi:hypothetical protein